MTDVVTVTNSGSHMTCSICQRSTTRINLSSCFHSFCPDCLVSRVYKEGLYQCPICQTRVNVSETESGTNTGSYVVREDASRSGNIRVLSRNNEFPVVNRESSPGGINHFPVSSRSRPVSFRNPDTVTNDNNGSIINFIPVSPRNTTTRSYVLNSPGPSRYRPDNLEVSRTVIPISTESRHSPDVTYFPAISPASRINYVTTAPETRTYNNGLEVTRTRIPARYSPNTGLSPVPNENNKKSCDICQDGRIAVSHCVQCEQTFCQTCRVAHLKMKASRFHEQKPILGQGQRRNDVSPARSHRSRTSEFCSRHGSEISCVCKRCEIMICDICKSTEHESHVTRPVAEEAAEVRKNLAVMLQKHITMSERLKLQLIEAEKRQGQYPKDLDNELVKVNRQMEDMKMELERTRQQAEDELSSHYTENIERNNKMLNTTQKQYNELQSVKSETLEMLNSDDDVKVAQRGASLQRRLDEVERECRRKEERLTGPSLQFFQGDIDPGRIRNMFGGVTSGNPRYESFPRYSSDASIHTAASTPVDEGIATVSRLSLPFTDGVGYVYGIAPVNSETAWISLLGHNVVALVTRKGNIVSSVDIGAIAEDVTFDGMGGCYVTCPGNKCIKHISQDGNVSTLVENLQQIPHGISVYQYFDSARNGYIQEIFVCFTEPRGTTTSLFDKAKGSVHVFANNGDELGSGFLMQSPVRIDANPDSDIICVSDHSNGCVTICDKNGQNVQALFTGNDQEENNFKPLGVCFDGNGHVLIADWKGERVTRISQDGSRSELLVRDVKGPQSVAVKSGYLWVGGKHGVVHVYQMN